MASSEKNDIALSWLRNMDVETETPVEGIVTGKIGE